MKNHSILIETFDDDLGTAVSSDGWSLDILLPKDIHVSPGAEFSIRPTFSIQMPSSVIGTLYSKAKGNFSILKGEIIHPEYIGTLNITLKYKGSSSDRFTAGTPVCQLVFSPLYSARSLVSIQEY